MSVCAMYTVWTNKHTTNITIFLCRKIVDGHSVTKAATVKEARAEVENFAQVFGLCSIVHRCRCVTVIYLISLYRCMPPPSPSKLVPSQRVRADLFVREKKIHFEGFQRNFCCCSFSNVDRIGSNHIARHVEHERAWRARARAHRPRQYEN